MYQKSGSKTMSEQQVEHLEVFWCSLPPSLLSYSREFVKLVSEWTRSLSMTNILRDFIVVDIAGDDEAIRREVCIHKPIVFKI